jgi:hypothetical protein
MAHFPLDENNLLWVKGWGVFRMSPWHFHGLYATRAQADSEHAALGAAYQVSYGSRRLASDEFITSGGGPDAGFD